MPIADTVRQLQIALGPITLVAVTKGRTSQEILELLQAGVVNIAENRLQEAAEKFTQLNGNLLFARCTTHFIGHVQSNKAAEIAARFDVVQSVDSLKVAEKLSAAAQRLGKQLRIFLQVNATGERQKHGCLPGAAPELAVATRKLPSLNLVGIMGIGPQGSEAEIRQCFRTLKSIQQQLSLPELSMGMSDDYAIAIAEGSTMVRIGRLLFSP